MGLGKSVITLTAMKMLFESETICKVLVIAPLRVARDTWPQEIKKWDHLKGMKYAVAVGTEAERKAAVQRLWKASLQTRNTKALRSFKKNSR